MSFADEVKSRGNSNIVWLFARLLEEGNVSEEKLITLLGDDYHSLLTRLMDRNGVDAMGEVVDLPTEFTLLRRLRDFLTDISLAAGANQIGARSRAGLLSSGVLSADTLIKNGPGETYWISFSDTAALSLELNDSLDNSGTDQWGLDIPANGYGIVIFDPPLEFATGIYLDVSTATCKVTVGYK